MSSTYTMNENCNKSTEKIGRHDERIKSLENFVQTIMENHLPHINGELTAIKLQQAYWAGGLAVLIFFATLFIKFL